MLKQLAAAIALALPLSAYALSNSFSYQGSLNDGGSPASGNYDLQFQLQTSAGVNVGAPLVREDVAVSGGLFSVELDFGAAITSADFRLQIGVRPGASTGAYTTLSPTTNLRPTPQAQVAGIASEAVTVSPDSITSASIQGGAVTTSDIADGSINSAKVQDGSLTGFDVQDGSISGVDVQDASIAGIDIQDGGVTTNDIADGTILALDVNTALVQARVNTSCLAGSAIRAIDQGGSVTCEPIPAGGSGTVTSIDSGAGLSGGPITTTGTLSIATGGVTSAMIADGAVASVDVADGSIAAFDLAGDSVNASKIVDGAVGAADIDSSQVQRRVSGTCAAGSSIRDISATGTVTCESDDGTGTVTSVASGAGLTGGPITASGTLSIATGGVTSTMIADGTVANADLAANAVNAGNIVDGSVGSADLNTAQVQTRVTGTCAAGSSIRDISATGAVTCETDDTGPAGWSLTGNNGTNPATQFIGTTDFQALVLRVNNASVLRMEPNSNGPNLIGGLSANTVTPGVAGATISGGGQNGFPNLVTDSHGTIGGGVNNVAGDGLGSTVDERFATVGGGNSNTASAVQSTVAGGARNTASGGVSSIGGGDSNTASGVFSTVSGGSSNTASGSHSSVGGGSFNCAGGSSSWAGGKGAKVRPGSESGSSGSGCENVATVGTAGDEGTFVWADSQAGSFVSTGPNQFLVRADGGVGINGTPVSAEFEFNVFGTTPFDGFVEFGLIPKPSLNGNIGERIEFGVGKGGAGPNDADLRIVHRNNGSGFFEHLSIDGDGSVIVRSNPANTAQGVQLAIGAGAWSTLSDRNLKTDIEAILPLDVLERLVAMPIQQWRYIGQPGEVQHIGPMAQDFAAAFGVGENDTTISTVDADGVALAAIQGLNQKLESENAALRAELAELRALVLERMRD